MSKQNALMLDKLGTVLASLAKLAEMETDFELCTLYVPVIDSEQTLSENTLCAVIIYDEAGEEEIPEVVTKYQLQAMIDFPLALDITEQAFEQMPDASNSDLVDAVRYYLLNDAYIDFSDG